MSIPALSIPYEEARDFAIAAHGDQKYGGDPYAVHLDAVAAIAAPYGETALILAYLHDVVEDTSVTLTDIEKRFGAEIAACVALLTDAPGATRKERKATTYAKLAEVTGPQEIALLVKAADRLANVRSCVQDGLTRLFEVYRSEQAVFRQSAFRPGLCDPIWVELEELLSRNSPTAES